jgi:transcriptional regulator with XRE-family HTH domain
MNFNIGAKIKALRLAASMTQEQLANKLGISAQAVSKWESGTNMPDIQILPALSVIFGVTIDSLFDITDENKMTRLENMLCGVRFLSEEDFIPASRLEEWRLNKDDLRPELLLPDAAYAQFFALPATRKAMAADKALQKKLKQTHAPE